MTAFLRHHTQWLFVPLATCQLHHSHLLVRSLRHRFRPQSSSRSPAAYANLNPALQSHIDFVEQACEQAIGEGTAYDHSKVADWNTAIIVSPPLPPVALRTRPHPPSLPSPHPSRRLKPCIPLRSLHSPHLAIHPQIPHRENLLHVRVQHVRRACPTRLQIHRQQHRHPAHWLPLRTREARSSRHAQRCRRLLEQREGRHL